ncbi:MAG TPA: hypothetical protein VLJ39_09990 [Tepidisphaeraceae bacterium]|nr:hypothetical protein [Tepidisphaeraceae bacterium]
MPIQFSIRKSARRVSAAALMSAALVAGGVGCSTQPKVVYDPVNTKPIVGDDAMAFRSDWSKSACYYPNGDVAAWSTRFPYQDQESQSDTGNLVLDTLTFVAETAFLPVELVANPPGTPVVYYGAKYRPTYTAQPPLPPKGGMTPLSGRLYSGSAPGANSPSQY